MTTTPAPIPVAPTAFGPVAVDLYRDIHKGIRADLFALCGEAGSVDASIPEARAALGAHATSVVDLLVTHAEHEDVHVQPALEQHLPELAEQIATDHDHLEHRIADLANRAATLAAGGAGEPRWRLQELYLDLGSFTSAYLAHQDLEERVVMPALDAAIGAEAVLAIHQAIIGSIPPEQMATSLALMLPAMNVDDRAELLGGMRAGAPAEAFDGVWSLTGSVLDPVDVASLATRLDL